MNLSDAYNKFLEHCKSTTNLSPLTLRAYQSDFNDCQRYFLKSEEIEKIDRNYLCQYIRNMRDYRNLKETTIKRRLASLKILFKWATLEGVISTNPFDTMHERIRLPKRLPRALDRHDRNVLAHTAEFSKNASNFKSIRDKTMIHLLLGTGIRVGELIAISLHDISISSRSLIIHGKGNRQRLVYFLHDSLYEKIVIYIKIRNTLKNCSGKLFVSPKGCPIGTPEVRTVVRRTARSAGITRRVTPHMLRHTCATQWLEHGLDIRHVQKLLGHQSISTTEIYTHISDQGLREALLRAEGGR